MHRGNGSTVLIASGLAIVLLAGGLAIVKRRVILLENEARISRELVL
jgi:hypothetical protein